LEKCANNAYSYNSAIFETLAANQYHASVVTEGFLTGGSIATDLDATGYGDNSLRDPSYLAALQQKLMSQPERFKTLSNEECINKYSGSFITDAADVIGITKDALDSITNTTVWVYSTLQEVQVINGAWLYHADIQNSAGVIIPTPRGDFSVGHLLICADHVREQEDSSWTEKYCSINDISRNSTSWSVFGKSISYCLSEIRPEQCQLQFSITILWVVIVFNLIKALSMLWILFRLRDHPLVTLGDAVSSFLQRPDQTTKGYCLLSRADVERGQWPGVSSYESSLRDQSSGRRWFGAVTKRRAYACIML
jgi:hypothetical protein